MTVDYVRWDSDPYWDIPWVRPMRPGTMPWALQLVTPPTQEPISLEQLKWHLRISHDDDDQLLSMYLGAARQFVEMRTGLCMMPQTWKLVLDRWPRQDRIETWPVSAPLGTILLPRYPVQSVTSVVYTDNAAVNHTVSSSLYVTDLATRPPRIAPAAGGTSWPSTSLAPVAAVQVTFLAGHATAVAIQPLALQAIVLMAGHWYENREAVSLDARSAVQVPFGAQSLIDMLSPVFVG